MSISSFTYLLELQKETKQGSEVLLTEINKTPEVATLVRVITDSHEFPYLVQTADGKLKRCNHRLIAWPI